MGNREFISSPCRGAMKRYARIIPNLDNDEYKVDYNDTYSAAECAELINAAYWSRQLPPPIVPIFLEYEADNDTNAT